MPGIFRLSEGAKKRLAAELALLRLWALGAVLNLHPRYRHHLKDKDPLGRPCEFRARFLFELDGGYAIHAVFGGGQVRVGRGKIENPDLKVRFRTVRAMRSFFSGGDTLNALIQNELSFYGNLSYLLRFGHMSRDVLLRGKARVPRVSWSATHGPASWQELSAPPAGEPCREPATGETEFLDDPYLANVTLDDFPRIKKLLWIFRTTQPEICSERARLLTEFMLRHRSSPQAGEPVVLRQGRAIHHILCHKQASIWPEDLLAGTTASKRIGVVIYPETGGLGIWPELLTVEARPLNPYRISAEDRETLDRRVFPFWMEDNIRDWAKRRFGHPQVLELDERFVLYFMWKTQAVSHTVADLPRVLRLGLGEIIARAAGKEAQAGEEKQRAFYRAVQLALRGVLDYTARLAARAGELAAGESDPERRRELTRMAESLRRVPAEPARDLYDALQATWLLFLCQHQENMNAGLSLGRLDVWLQPYLRAELDGVSDPVERKRRLLGALELTCAFMLKLTDHLPLVPDLGNRLFGGSSSDQVITLGGQTRDGKSAVCDMTYLFLKATEMLRLRDPNMNARFAPGVNSEAYLKRLCQVNLLTRATPSLHNDAAVEKALAAQGFPPEDARDWSATGCVEPTICGKHFGHTNSMMFNLVAPLEMALHDGVHPLLGERIGPATGDPRKFASWEQFREAYFAQLGWLIDRSVEANNLLGRAHQAEKPTPLLSALFQGPLEKGYDLIEGGAVYNSSGTAMIGLADVIDSLAAIKTLVFEKKLFSMDELLRALDRDFVGAETLHAALLNQAPKFGQGHALPGELAREIMQFAFTRFQGHANYRGGKYLTGYWSMSNHVAFGVLSGALPSGRRRGQAFTPGLTPSVFSRATLSEQIRAVAALDPVLVPNNIAFNVKVAPGAGDTQAAVVERLSAYCRAYFELGGMQMQFNLVSSDTLRRALEQPEQYRDLMVRISGYNAYFVELNPDIQQEIIERMEHGLGR